MQRENKARIESSRKQQGRTRRHRSSIVLVFVIAAPYYSGCIFTFYLAFIIPIIRFATIIIIIGSIRLAKHTILHLAPCLSSLRSAQ